MSFLYLDQASTSKIFLLEKACIISLINPIDNHRHLTLLSPPSSPHTGLRRPSGIFNMEDKLATWECFIDAHQHYLCTPVQYGLGKSLSQNIDHAHGCALL